jgi:hypothetical protein
MSTTVTETETVAERVARGAAWLDEVKPGWRGRVDVAELDMTLTTDCVLGQVFATETARYGYWGGLRMLTASQPHEFSDILARQHGFLGHSDSDAEYDELRAEWARVIG